MSSKNILFSLALLLGMSTASHAGAQTRGSYEENDLLNPIPSYARLKSNESLGTVLRIDYQNYKEVPSEFREFIPGREFDYPHGLSIYFGVTNDYNILEPVGVKADTDDHGYTHGSKIMIGGFLPQGHYISFDYSTDLFTKPIDGIVKQADGSRVARQNFTTETILKVVLDNIDKARGQTFYWRAEAGWQNLNSSNRGNFFSGATQQMRFHELVNSFKTGQTKTPIDIDDGRGSRDAAILGLYVGVAKEFLNAKNTCRARLFSEAGSQASTIDGASYVTSKTGTVLWCQQGPRSWVIRGEVAYEAKAFQNGYQGTSYADISTGKNKWRIGFRYEQSHGDLINYVNYNLRNEGNNKIDPLFMIYFRLYF